MDTELLVRAGLAAVPYLLRQQQWDNAAGLLEGAFVRDPSRANAAAVLPAIQQITRHEPALGGRAGQGARGDRPGHRRCQAPRRHGRRRRPRRLPGRGGSAGRLLDLCRATGRLAEALDVAEQKAATPARPALAPGPSWPTRSGGCRCWPRWGAPARSWTRSPGSATAWPPCPPPPAPTRARTTWHVREALLDTGRYAAMLAGRLPTRSSFIAEVVASQQTATPPPASSPAPGTTTTSRCCTSAAPRKHWRCCRTAARSSRTPATPSCSARHSAPSPTSRKRAATATPPSGWNATRLRYAYLAGDVEGIAIGYHNLGNYLAGHARQPAPAFASHLTSALICALIGNEDNAESIEAAATDLRGFGPDDVAARRHGGPVPPDRRHPRHEPARPHRTVLSRSGNRRGRHSATSSRRPKNWRSVPRPRPAPTNPETPLGAPAFTPGRACRLHTGPGVPPSHRAGRAAFTPGRACPFRLICPGGTAARPMITEF